MTTRTQLKAGKLAPITARRSGSLGTQGRRHLENHNEALLVRTHSKPAGGTNLTKRSSVPPIVRSYR